MECRAWDSYLLTVDKRSSSIDNRTNLKLWQMGMGGGSSGEQLVVLILGRLRKTSTPARLPTLLRARPLGAVAMVAAVETVALLEMAMATEAVEGTRIASTTAADGPHGNLTTEATVTSTTDTTLSREADAPSETKREREKTRCVKKIVTQTE